MTAPLFPTPSINNPVDLFIYVNTSTGFIFGYIGLLAIFTITFLSLKVYTSERAFATASWVTFLSTVFFAAMTIVQPITVIFPTIMTIVSTVLLIRGEE